MNPSALRHLLVFERSTETVTPSGGVDTVWSEFARARAELVEGSKTEEQQERGAVSITAYTFRARYLPGVTLADRVSYGGKPFDIVELSDVDRRAGSMAIKVRRTGP